MFFHDCHAHARIRVLVNIFSKDSQVWNKCSVVYHICHFDFQRRSKKLYTLRIKNPRMKKSHPPFPVRIPTLQLSDTSPTKNFMNKLPVFVPNIRFEVFFSFLAVVIRIYQPK